MADWIELSVLAQEIARSAREYIAEPSLPLGPQERLRIHELAENIDVTVAEVLRLDQEGVILQEPPREAVGKLDVARLHIGELRENPGFGTRSIASFNFVVNGLNDFLLAAAGPHGPGGGKPGWPPPR